MSRTFDGSTQTLTAAVDLSATDRITVGGWLWWNAYAADGRVALALDTAAFKGFFVQPNATNGLFGFQGANYAADIARPSAAAWHHVAFTFNRAAALNSAITPYVDGLPVAYTNRGLSPDTGNFESGTLRFASSVTFSPGACRLSNWWIRPGQLATAREILLVARGLNPQELWPTERLYHWPLTGRNTPEPELGYAASATLVAAPTQSNGPAVTPIALPPIGAA